VAAFWHSLAGLLPRDCEVRWGKGRPNGGERCAFAPLTPTTDVARGAARDDLSCRGPGRVPGNGLVLESRRGGCRAGTRRPDTLSHRRQMIVRIPECSPPAGRSLRRGSTLDPDGSLRDLLPGSLPPPLRP
jgi:hypothetical protein